MSANVLSAGIEVYSATYQNDPRRKSECLTGKLRSRVGGRLELPGDRLHVRHKKAALFEDRLLARRDSAPGMGRCVRKNGGDGDA